MAKKKAVKKKNALPTKKLVKRKAVVKKGPRKPAAAVKKSAKPAAKKTAPAPTVEIGRPRVPGDARLDMLFREDYHARQVFEFLRVRTVRDLEEHSPKGIVNVLSEPVKQTVLRIRQRLARFNRHLAEDRDFLAEYVSAGKEQSDPDPDDLL